MCLHPCGGLGGAQPCSLAQRDATWKCALSDFFKEKSFSTQKDGIVGWICPCLNAAPRTK